MYVLRMLLAVTFGVTASNDTMSTYMSMLPQPGLGRRLRFKTSHDASIVVAVVDFSPYLDLLYAHIADEPNITVKKLSAYFVADHCKFCDPIALKETIVRLKRRHAIFEAWRKELDQDFGLVREEGLPSIEPRAI